jgi:hypothetical protein
MLFLSHLVSFLTCSSSHCLPSISIRPNIFICVSRFYGGVSWFISPSIVYVSPLQGKHCEFFLFFLPVVIMVVIRECDESGRVMVPSTAEAKREIWNQCLKHVKRPNGTFDLNALETRYFGHPLFSDMSSSSDSDGNSSSDSDCVFLYSSPGSLVMRDGNRFPTICGDKRFTDGVIHVESRFTDPHRIKFLRSKLEVSSTGTEEDVMLETSHPGEKVCLPLPQGVTDEIFHFYASVF